MNYPRSLQCSSIDITSVNTNSDKANEFRTSVVVRINEALLC